MKKNKVVDYLNRVKNGEALELGWPFVGNKVYKEGENLVLHYRECDPISYPLNALEMEKIFRLTGEPMTYSDESDAEKTMQFAWQRSLVLYGPKLDGDNAKLLEGEYRIIHYPKEVLKDRKAFIACKGDVIFGFVLLHICGQWCFQSYEWCPALSLESIRFIENSVANADEIFETKKENYNG
jgi:hypothetical protein